MKPSTGNIRKHQQHEEITTNIMEKKIQNISIILLTILLILTSCRNSDTENHPIEGGKAVVKINMGGTDFETETPGLLASVNKNFDNGLQSQKNEIQLNKDLVMVAELVPETSSIQAKASLSGGSVNTTSVEELPLNTPYKVAVFDASGNYVNERDYIYGQEASTPELSLDGGSQYTFIAYSASKALTLPVITFSNPANKTLATASLNVRGIDDVTYFRKDMVVSGNGINYLDIVLKHKQSQIITKVDASATGYNISALNAWIGPITTNSIMQLSDGSIAPSGGTGEIFINIASGLNTPIVTGIPMILNANTSTGRLIFRRITIGSVTQNDLTVLNNLKITPGVKYNLNITINPTDTYLTHQGQLAARINGKIWMRYNLGDSRANPDVAPFNQYNYYQFGRSAVVANAATGTGAISGYDATTVPANNSWNSGTEAAPIKTTTDPCPTGYRIPTQTEVNELLASTTQSNIGVWNQGSTNAATVLTSNRTSSVRLTLPATGSRGSNAGGVVDGTLSNRGVYGWFWTSTSTTSPNAFALNVQQTTAPVSTLHRNRGLSIRCIAQ
ncbi:FISUMP domain-containing protein [Elizabethkingia meningoseptica]|uniref:FISUMP domain-containing protein n=1 Tax=Elizabethkingia meningoseptica TaxID=238 RepID=UPI003891E6D2